MAKAGFWMRGARGKLAGASFAKGQNGQTIQREIKTPRNPNTNPQLFQRAIMATIMRAYSAGKKVFDHSYEGISVGSKCQQKFMRDNLKTLRAKLFAEYSAGGSVVDMTARVIGRGGINPVANEYKISEGTLVNNVLTTQNGKDYVFTGADTADLTVAGWLQQAGVVEDDIFTVCAFLNNPERIVGGYEGVEAAQYVAGVFAWVRMEVKLSAFTDNSLISEATISDVFEIVENNSLNGFDGDALITAGFDASTWGNGYNAGASACIRSRRNSILRSTANMISFNKNEHDFGIKAPYVTALWTKGATTLGDSDLLLEGGDGAQQAPPRPAVPTIMSYSKPFPIQTSDAPFQIIMSEDVTPNLVAPSLKLYYNDGSVKVMNGTLQSDNSIIFKEVDEEYWSATVSGNIITVSDISSGHAYDIVSAEFLSNQVPVPTPPPANQFGFYFRDDQNNQVIAINKNTGHISRLRLDVNGELYGAAAENNQGSYSIAGLSATDPIDTKLSSAFDTIDGTYDDDTGKIVIDGIVNDNVALKYSSAPMYYTNQKEDGVYLFTISSLSKNIMILRRDGKNYLFATADGSVALYSTPIQKMEFSDSEDQVVKFYSNDMTYIRLEGVGYWEDEGAQQTAHDALAAAGIEIEGLVDFSDDEAHSDQSIPFILS